MHSTEDFETKKSWNILCYLVTRCPYYGCLLISRDLHFSWQCGLQIPHTKDEHSFSNPPTSPLNLTRQTNAYRNSKNRFFSLHFYIITLSISRSLKCHYWGFPTAKFTDSSPFLCMPHTCITVHCLWLDDCHTLRRSKLRSSSLHNFYHIPAKSLPFSTNFLLSPMFLVILNLHFP